MKSHTKITPLKMTNSVDPKGNRRHDIHDDSSAESVKVAEIAPSEDLTLRVEQIFEEAEELWQWMYNN
jgi:hypothetical protein